MAGYGGKPGRTGALSPARAPRLRAPAREAVARHGNDGFAYVAVLFLLVVVTTLGMTLLIRVAAQRAPFANRFAAMQAEYLSQAAVDHAAYLLTHDETFPADETVYTMHSLGAGRYGYKARRHSSTTYATVATVGVVENQVVRHSYVLYVVPPPAVPDGAFVVYDTNTIVQDRYPWLREHDGREWSVAEKMFNAGNRATNYMVVHGHPTRRELSVGAVQGTGGLKFEVWNGSVWSHRAFTSGASGASQCFDLAYETQSGQVLFAGRRDTTLVLWYCTWTGSSWTDVLPGATLAGTGRIEWVTMAADPDSASNEILVAASTSANQISLFRWTGSAFQDLGQIEAGATNGPLAKVAIAYEQQPPYDAVVLWGKGDGPWQTCVWDGSALSSTEEVEDTPDGAAFFRIAADPAGTTILAAASRSGADRELDVAVWDGDEWSEVQLGLESDLIYSDRQSFDIAWQKDGGTAMLLWSRYATQGTKYITWSPGTDLADAVVTDGPDSGDVTALVRLFPSPGSNKIHVMLANLSAELWYYGFTGSAFIFEYLTAATLTSTTYMPFDMARTALP